MYKHILCPIDGSETANAGMHEAIQFAKEQNAQLHFLHVIDTYIPIVDMSGDFNITYMIDILRENGAKIIKKAAAAAEKAGVNADTKTIESVGGRTASYIVQEAENWPADLIIMGTHGLRGISRLVMGSDAENVLRTSNVPILLVKSPHAER
ncbi:MAG TPA: universal stress protein [Methylotenera sp.]|nr:universal stress protein [Methylotenera sp.]